VRTVFVGLPAIAVRRTGVQAPLVRDPEENLSQFAGPGEPDGRPITDREIRRGGHQRRGAVVPDRLPDDHG